MRDYAVVRHGSGRRSYWTVEIGSQVDGNYQSEWAALLEAIEAAHADEACGVAARVVLRASSTEPDAVLWRSGDPLPQHPVAG